MAYFLYSFNKDKKVEKNSKKICKKACNLSEYVVLYRCSPQGGGVILEN